MMRNILFVALIIHCLIHSPLNAQHIFQKTFGSPNDDLGQCVQQTADGGYIFVGTTNLGMGNIDILLIKTNAAGDTIWTKTYSRTRGQYAFSVRQTLDGGYIIAGYTHDLGFNIRGYVIKTDSAGNLVWSKVYGGLYHSYLYSVEQTSDSGFVFVGECTRYSMSWLVPYLFLIKTNSVGDTLWTTSCTTQHLIGSSANNTFGYSVKQTNDGGFVAVGNIGSFDMYLVKTNSSGLILWSRVIQGGMQNNDHLYSIVVADDGGFVLLGYTNLNGINGSDVALIKTDSLGNIMWSKCLGNTNGDYGISIAKTTDNGFIIGGSTYNTGSTIYDLLLIKTDSAGTPQWSKMYGGPLDDYALFGSSTHGPNVQQTTDGGYIFGGSTKSFGAGMKDLYMIKTDSLGNSGCNEVSVSLTVTNNTHVSSVPPNITYNEQILYADTTILGSITLLDSTLCSLNTSISGELVQEMFSIYPNPVSLLLVVSGYAGNDLHIYDLMGKKMLNFNIHEKSENRILLDISKLQQGMYVLRCGNYAKRFIRN